jgi:hypothetical protein
MRRSKAEWHVQLKLCHPPDGCVRNVMEGLSSLREELEGCSENSLQQFCIDSLVQPTQSISIDDLHKAINCPSVPRTLVPFPFLSSKLGLRNLQWVRYVPIAVGGCTASNACEWVSPR